MFDALVRRREPENKLTEMLACVLAGDAAFGVELLLAAGFEGYTVRAVETQIYTGVGQHTTDMCLALETGACESAMLWSEHKLDSPFGNGQLDSYEQALRVRRANGERLELQVILDEPPKREEAVQLERMGAHILFWSQVADAVERVQVRRSPSWYLDAARRGAPVALRVLAEFAVYLEQEVGVGAYAPLTDAKLDALDNYKSALNSLDALIHRVATQLGVGGAAKDVEGAADEQWLEIPVIGWWNALDDASLWLWTAPTDLLATSSGSVWSFGVSVEILEGSLGGRAYGPAFRDACARASLKVERYDFSKSLLVGRSVALRSLRQRDSLTAQARELATLLEPVIKRLYECVPDGEHQDVPPKGSRGLHALDPRKL